MPAAQFNPFEKLEQLIMPSGAEGDAHKIWDKPRDEWNGHLESVGEDLAAGVGK
jgi:hypothetical protein